MDVSITRSRKGHVIELFTLLTDRTAFMKRQAYSKISIGFRNNVSQRRPSNVNVAKILGNGNVSTHTTSSAMGCAVGLCISEHFALDEVYIALPGEARVLISHTGRSGKQGAVRGDVLTHIDGEAVAGKDVNQVMRLLHAKRDKGPLKLTLNAERSVAEALKRRAASIVDTYPIF
jgi:hypothetical protein